MLSIKIDIPIFYGSLTDLTKLDLSFLNYEIVVYKGRKFSAKLQLLLNKTKKDHEFLYAVQDLRSDSNGANIIENQNVKRYALMPLDISKPFNESDWYHFYQLMLCLFPSDFTLLEVIELNKNGNFYEIGSKGYYGFHSTGEKYFEKFLFFRGQEYKFVNSFLKAYFTSSKNLNYIKYILSLYTNSFQERNSIFKYISLVICLEVVIEGKEQLTYRLKRNVALLCGTNIPSCEVIYNNIGELYDLRSDIVHGNIKPSFDKLKPYLEYLRMLVARLIRELIVHNIPSISDLNKKLTTLGYGQNNLISSNYKFYKYPLVDNIRLKFRMVERYKKKPKKG